MAYHINTGDILTLSYDRKSHFDVLMFVRAGTEKPCTFPLHFVPRDDPTDHDPTDMYIPQDLTDVAFLKPCDKGKRVLTPSQEGMLHKNRKPYVPNNL